MKPKDDQSEGQVIQSYNVFISSTDADFDPTSLTVMETQAQPDPQNELNGRRLWKKTNYKKLLSGIKSTSFQLFGLQEGSGYTFLIQAKFKGDSLTGDETYALTDPIDYKVAVEPKEPTYLRKDKARSTYDSYRLVWEPSADDGGAPILGYEVQWDAGTDSTFEKLGYTKENGFRLPKLQQQNRYKFKVRCENEIGFSKHSNELVIKTPIMQDLLSDSLQDEVELLTFSTFSNTNTQPID